jgi:hypothetical protein
MKKSYNFLETAPLYSIFLFVFLIFAVFVSLLSYFLFHQVTKIYNPLISVEGGVGLGLIFATCITLMFNEMRKSAKFWSYAKEVESLVDKAETKRRLESIRKWEYENLIELSQGGPHIVELERLLTIMETKYKFVN